MDRMILVAEDEAVAKRGKKMENKDENKTNAPDDIRVKLLYDDQMKK